MGFDDFFDFDEDAYKKEIYSLSEEALRREHAIIRQKCLSSKASIGLGFASAFHTGGTSLIFSGMGVRRNIYNEKKKEIIEKCMEEENWKPSDLRKRDIFKAIGPAVIAGTVAPGVDGLVGHLAGHGATTFAAHHLSETASCAIHDPTPFFHAVEAGFHTQAAAVAHGLAGHAGQLVPVDSVATCTTDFFGNMVGQSAASTAEIAITKRAAKMGVDFALDKCVNPKMASNKIHREPEKSGVLKSESESDNEPDKEPSEEEEIEWPATKRTIKGNQNRKSW